MEYLGLLKDIFFTNGRYMYMIKGLLFSIGTTAFAALLGIALGIFIALMELSHFYPLKNIKGYENFNPISKLYFSLQHNSFSILLKSSNILNHDQVYLLHKK